MEARGTILLKLRRQFGQSFRLLMENSGWRFFSKAAGLVFNRYAAFVNWLAHGTC
jgi:hypothetical protein